MNQKEHDNLIGYLQEIIQLVMKARPSYSEFMDTPSIQPYHDTFNELLAIDAESAGI